VAVTGVGHYHAAYYPGYLDLLRKHGCEIVGVADPDPRIAADRARLCDSVAFEDYREMLESTRPEFVVALGRHVDMPDVFRHLVAAGVPFLMEKPWGIDAATMSGLAALALDRRAWACVPFPMRFSPWAELTKQMYVAGELGEISHGLFRMVRPGCAALH
jgi:predicted dehydrogenase